MNRSSAEIEAIVSNVVAKIAGLRQAEKSPEGRMPIRIEASARHVHLNAAAMEKLFGPNETLKKARDLSQPGEFLAEQRVKVVTPKGEVANVAVLGPLRDAVQVELSQTDCRMLGIAAPVNVSGDLSAAGDAFLVGPAGMIEARTSVIVARAHAHLCPEDARQYGLCDGQVVSVEVANHDNPRRVTFGGVVVRVREGFATAVHIDLDEANACMLGTESRAHILCEKARALPDREGRKDAVRSTANADNTCCSCSEKVLTEGMAKAIVASCSCRRINIGSGTVVTPSARDIFSAAKWVVERGQ